MSVADLRAALGGMKAALDAGVSGGGDEAPLQRIADEYSNLESPAGSGAGGGDDAVTVLDEAEVARRRLTAFYEAHNPSKVGNVGTILKKRVCGVRAAGRARYVRGALHRANATTPPR